MENYTGLKDFGVYLTKILEMDVFFLNEDRHTNNIAVIYDERVYSRRRSYMKIRRANKNDLKGINKLLHQVLMVHHNGRPDLFKANVKKYMDEELIGIIEDDARPIFVGVDEEDEVLGYAFCVFQQHIDDNILTDIKTLYIDDLCVDEEKRGMHIGKQIYEYVLAFAREQGCYNVTLNVWSCNPTAMKFYESCGLVPQKIGMETIL